MAAVGLQHFFPWAARTDSSAEPGEHAAEAFQARQDVPELCELDLYLRLRAARPPGEDVEYHFRAPDHTAFEDGFEVSNLGGLYRVQVEYDEPDVLFGDD